MKRAMIILISGFILSTQIAAQVNQPGGPLGEKATTGSAWNGQFSGSINGTKSTLSFQTSGNNIKGSINADGYIYNLSGTVSVNQSSGKLTDSNTQSSMNYTGTLSGDQVTIILEVPGQNGQSSQYQLVFKRGGGSSVDESSNQAQGDGNQQNVERDQRLIGGWRHTESYTSGDFGAVSEWYMQIKKDGTYRYGDGQVMGGDGGSSFDSGQGDASTGQWKTANGVVYINEGFGWQPYTNYIVDANSMLFKFDDGSKQLWERYK